MGNPIEISGRLLTKNWALNFFGQVLPLVVGLATIPYVVRGLGAERFGVLSIAWVLLGYFGLFDLGLGRATTKFVAECLGKGDTRRLPGLVWTSLWSQVLFGLAGALLAAAATPFLVERVLKLSPVLRGETEASFFILAASLPLVLAGNALRGVLEAAQRFDWVNYVKAPANLSIFLLPALALPFGWRLPGVVSLLVAARAVSALAYLGFSFRMFPVLRQDFSLDLSMLRPLLAFGGWVTVSNVVGPFLTYMDRFFIGSVVSMSAVGYYTAPYEAITRVWAIPSSLTATVFPAFSALDAAGSKQRLEELCARSLKSLLLTLGPTLLLVMFFAREILARWLGPEFAGKGTLVLQLLAAGALINSLAFVPFGLLHGLGRPDLTAKIHLLELPFYFVALPYLLRSMGIAGAALAWTLRVATDAVLIFGAVILLRRVSLRRLVGNGVVRAAITLCSFGALFEILKLAAVPLWLQGLFAAALLLAFLAAAWKYLLDGSDRSLVLSAAGHLRTALARAK